MFPSARSLHALLGKDAARAAACSAQTVIWGRCGSTPAAHKAGGDMDVSVSGGRKAPSLAARATCYTVTCCYSRLPGYTVGTDLTQESMPQTATPPIEDRSRFFALIYVTSSPVGATRLGQILRQYCQKFQFRGHTGTPIVLRCKSAKATCEHPTISYT